MIDIILIVLFAASLTLLITLIVDIRSFRKMIQGYVDDDKIDWPTRRESDG